MTIASEITRLQGAKANLKTSIEAKGVTVPSSATIDTYSGYVDQIQTSSSIVNGVIESYLASTSTVAADTFVEFVNQWGTDTELSNTPNAGLYISAVGLDSSRVFIAHSYGNSRDLYGIVATINGSAITFGDDTSLGDGVAGYNISIALIDNDKVFIAHSTANASGYLQGLVATVSSSSITAGEDTRLNSNNNTGNVISTTVLDTDKVFVAYSYGSSSTLGVVCTASGTNISVGTATTIDSSYNRRASTCNLSSSKVFVAFCSPASGTDSVYSKVCTISGTTVTVSIRYSITSSYAYAGHCISSVALGSDKVFLAFSGGSFNNLYATVCTISGTSVTAGTDHQLFSNNYYGQNISAVQASPTKVLVFHTTGSSSQGLAVCECMVYGLGIAAGTDTTISTSAYAGASISAAKIGSNIFVAHALSSNRNLYGATCQTLAQASSTRIDGLTKDECTTSVPGDVWVLNS